MRLFSVLILAFAAKFAAADLLCGGRELSAGDAGRVGTLFMGQSPFSLKWTGEATDLIGQGTLCGIALNSTTVCQILDHSSGPTVAARMSCVDHAKNAAARKVGEGYFVYSEANGVGRFGCRNFGGREEIKKLVEISGCN